MERLPQNRLFVSFLAFTILINILINATWCFFYIEKCCTKIIMNDDSCESCISQFHKNLRVSSMIDTQYSLPVTA